MQYTGKDWVVTHVGRVPWPRRGVCGFCEVTHLEPVLIYDVVGERPGANIRVATCFDCFNTHIDPNNNPAAANAVDVAA